MLIIINVFLLSDKNVYIHDVDYCKLQNKLQFAKEVRIELSFWQYISMAIFICNYTHVIIIVLFGFRKLRILVLN